MSPAVLSAKDHRLAGRTILQLYSVLRTVRFHDESNKALLLATENLKDSLNLLWAALGGPIRLQFVDGVVFVNGARIRMVGGHKMQVDFLQAELSRLELGGLCFSRPVDTAALRKFLVVLAGSAESERELAELKTSLLELKDLAVELLEPQHFIEIDEEVDVRVDRKTFALQTYSKSVAAVRELIRAIQAGRPPDSRLRIARLVQDLVDVGSERVDYLWHLSMVRQQGFYASHHAANTCCMSIAMGQTLGIDRIDLADLGVAAMMADIGFALVPTHLERFDRSLSEGERAELLDTMREQVAALAGKGALTQPTVRRLVVAYEHHLPYLHPESGVAGYTHVFSRIVQVADAFDALMTRRPWRSSYSPSQALQSLQKDSGTRFDPLMVRVLAELYAIYGQGEAEAPPRLTTGLSMPSDLQPR